MGHIWKRYFNIKNQKGIHIQKTQKTPLNKQEKTGNLIEKFARAINRQFTEGETQMINKVYEKQRSENETNNDILLILQIGKKWKSWKNTRRW